MLLQWIICFFECEFNHPIGNWNVSNVNNMECMFCNSIFNHPIDNWDVSNVTNMEGIFDDSSIDPLPIWYNV